MKFNKKSVGTKTVNLAGGKAYKQSERLEFLSILFTSFLKDQFYRTADETSARLKALVAKEDKKFVAKAALYARTQLGMRSVSHLVASELAHSVKGEEWSKSFFQKIVHRPDDMTEIAACYFHEYGKPMPNAMKKGFAAALSGLDEYKLAKYRMEGKDVTMVDLVNLVHPKHTAAIAKLVKGELKNTETWEARLSAAGKLEGEEEDVDAAKSGAWMELLTARKLGYFALLRNLRNILEQAPESLPMVCEQLVDPAAIAHSLVLPFRFLSAFKALGGSAAPGVRPVLIALSKAVDLSLANVPKFEGKTLIVMDESGSMSTVIDKASLFAAVLYKSCDADLMLFANTARYVTLMPTDSTLTLAKMLADSAVQGGTNFNSIFPAANKKYDRVIILSDMQGWMGGVTPVASFEAYKKRTGANPHIFSFDLAGYGSIQFPEPQVYCLAGFSDKILGVLSFLEGDRKALEHAIEEIVL